MKLRLVLLAALVAALALVASASASFQTGTYRGKTSQGLSLEFKVIGEKVKRLHFSDIALCSSGFGSKGKFANVHGPIVHGRFKVTLKGNDGATTMTITGKLQGRKAGGTIVDQTRLDTSGAPDPSGSVTCSAHLRWAATTG